ncbi:MAG: DUF86 domain-containing protein [Polyangiaceae bacterium]|nr:DUF86 domain-containing protein [Polyangiaceae bacterium]
MTPEEAQAKLLQLAEVMDRLRALPHSDLDEFRSDDRNIDAALRRLQVAIQILIDVGSHLVAMLGLGAPDSSRDLLERLEKGGHLPAGSTVRFGKAFAFRNRIVHLYDRVDDAIVFEIVRDHGAAAGGPRGARGSICRAASPSHG